jgi:hypothetical protein
VVVYASLYLSMDVTREKREKKIKKRRLPSTKFCILNRDDWYCCTGEYSSIQAGADVEFWSGDNYQIVIVYQVQTH